MDKRIEKEMRNRAVALATNRFGPGEVYDFIRHADDRWQYGVEWYGVPPNFGYVTMSAAGATREESLQNFLAELEEPLDTEFRNQRVSVSRQIA